MSEVKFKLAAGTNVGLIRQNNEDNFVVCSDLSTSNWLIPKAGDFADLGEYGILLVVADGMGGANAGEVASAIAVESIQKLYVPEQLEKVVGDDKSIQEFMKEVVKTADLNILHHSQTDSSTQGMGTTVVMAWILDNKAYVCWCGDSRCYVLNKRNGLIQLSKDHSYVQELVDKGRGMVYASLCEAIDDLTELDQYPVEWISWEKDGFFNPTYEAQLVDGTQVEFDKDGNWDKVDCNLNAVPTALIPASIAAYVHSNFPDCFIVKIDKERYGFEIELSNDLELKFNKQGQLLYIDD